MKADSLTLQSTEDGVFNNQMVGGVLVLDDVFIKEYLPDMSQTWGESPTDELESDIVQARFVISADTGLGSEYVSGDRNWNELFEIMKDIDDFKGSPLPEEMAPVVILNDFANAKKIV